MKTIPLNPFAPNRHILLAIDPSTTCVGYAFGDLRDKSIPRFGVLELQGKDPFERMIHFHRQFTAVVGTFPALADKQVLWMAIETQFVFKNPKTAITVGRGRGWAEMYAAIYGIPNLLEINPTEVKDQFTGWSKSNKIQMIDAVNRDKSLGVDLNIIPGRLRDNAADAVAICYVAMCEIHKEQLYKGG